MQTAVALPLVHFNPVLKQHAERNASGSGAGLATIGVYAVTTFDSEVGRPGALYPDTRQQPLMEMQVKMPSEPDPGHLAAHWVRRMAAVTLARAYL